MRHVEVNGTRMSAIGLGTWQFGSREWGYGDDYAREEAVRILDRALELQQAQVTQQELIASVTLIKSLGGGWR